ncbi:MAG: hypothetical protein ACREU7_09275 [Burkholderiales bacterium]
MIATIGTLVMNSLAGLSWFSTTEAVIALAALVYGIGGLVALRVVENRARSTADPVAASRPSYPPFKAAA